MRHRRSVHLLDGVVEDPQVALPVLLTTKWVQQSTASWPPPTRCCSAEDLRQLCRCMAGPGGRRRGGRGHGQGARRCPEDRRLQPESSTADNSEQLRGDLAEAVTALKNEPGVTDIAMSGSISIVRQLLDAGLSTNCTCWSTHRRTQGRPPVRRGTGPRSRCCWSPPRRSPRVFCTSSTPGPNRLLWVRARTWRTCARLRAAGNRRSHTLSGSRRNGRSKGASPACPRIVTEEMLIGLLSRAPGQEWPAGPRGVPSTPYGRSRSWVGQPKLVRAIHPVEGC